MLHVQKLIEDMAKGINLHGNLLIFEPVFKGKLIRTIPCRDAKCVSHTRTGRHGEKIREALVFKATELQVFAAICTRCGFKEYVVDAE